MNNLILASSFISKRRIHKVREKLNFSNGKSDVYSKLYLLKSRNCNNYVEIEQRLECSSLAVFYATSEMQLHLALAERCDALYSAGLFKEAIQDARRALKVRCAFDLKAALIRQ